MMAIGNHFDFDLLTTFMRLINHFNKSRYSTYSKIRLGENKSFTKFLLAVILFSTLKRKINHSNAISVFKLVKKEVLH